MELSKFRLGFYLTVEVSFHTSPRTYVQERMRLKPIRREKLQLNTFGNSAFDTCSCEVVQLEIQKANSNETLTITAYSSPVICSTLPTLVSPQEYEH